MKIASLVLGLCLIASMSFADVTAEIVKYDLDDNGNIRVWTSHAIDGVEVPSNYPKIDGKFVYATRYSKQNFKDCKDKAEIETYILDDIKNHSNNLCQKEFDKKAPKTFNQIRIDYNETANDSFAKTNLDKLISKGVSVTEVKQQIDSNNDGILDKEITLYPNGEKVETNITP